MVKINRITIEHKDKVKERCKTEGVRTSPPLAFLVRSLFYAPSVFFKMSKKIVQTVPKGFSRKALKRKDKRAKRRDGNKGRRERRGL